jgi:threonine/homoserine/homoserine lactone efflux protein
MGAEKISFFIMMLVTILMTDVGKVLGARRLRLLFSPIRMKWMNRIVGSILVVFGIRMILFAIAPA